MELALNPTNKYIAVEINSAIIRNKARTFDVYVQLAGKKFVSICSKGLALDSARLEHYISSGLKYLYAERKDIESMISNTELSEDAIKYPEEHFEQLALVYDILAVNLMDLHLNTINTVDTNGRPNRIEYIQKFSTQVTKLISDSPYAVSIMLSQFSKSEYYIQRAMQTAALAVHLFKLDNFKPITIQNSVSEKDVFEAALLMDVGLGSINEIPKHVSDELTHAVDDNYKVHPLFSMDYLTQHGLKNYLLLEAIEQHHERPDGKGFPLQLTDGQISYLAQILSLADGVSLAYCVSKYLKGSNFDDAIDSIKESETKLNPKLALLLDKLGNIGF